MNASLHAKANACQAALSQLADGTARGRNSTRTEQQELPALDARIEKTVDAPRVQIGKAFLPRFQDLLASAPEAFTEASVAATRLMRMAVGKRDENALDVTSQSGCLC